MSVSFTGLTNDHCFLLFVWLLPFLILTVFLVYLRWCVLSSLTLIEWISVQSACWQKCHHVGAQWLLTTSGWKCFNRHFELARWASPLIPLLILFESYRSRTGCSQQENAFSYFVSREAWHLCFFKNNFVLDVCRITAFEKNRSNLTLQNSADGPHQK